MKIVPNNTPNAMDVAIGIRNCACILFSAIIGIRPATVVKDVKSIGQLRRELEAAVDVEDYELAAKLRDEIMKSINDKT